MRDIEPVEMEVLEGLNDDTTSIYNNCGPGGCCVPNTRD